MFNFYDGDPRLQRWAEVIVDFCTHVHPGEHVEISGEISGRPLMLALYRRCIEKGAYPFIRPAFGEAAEIFYQSASDDQLDYVSPMTVFEAENTHVSLHVLAETNTRNLARVDPGRVARVRKARQHLSQIRKERVRWNITSFPTHAYAQDAGMSIRDLAELIFSAGFLNSDQPLKQWQHLRDRQRKMTALLEGTRAFRIETADCDLTLGVDGRRICESSGAVNMPDGEIYTGPVETDVNGRIRFSFPGYYMGQVVEGIDLEFRSGKVVKASASSNERFLMEMLDTDEGARRIGELGIGTNWGVTQFTKNLLFDEKMGGTIHLALGDAYRETLGENRSAIHWDILHDLRSGGRLYADNTVMMENGRFIGRFADVWEQEI
ncbi:aminopeptidase [bacterium]|nr:aminopeptidase [candidate division CSSED10-310 bacterium]